MVGSLGGKNGARAAHRIATKRARKQGLKARPGARVKKITMKAAKKKKKKKPAAVPGGLDLLEVCAYRGSALSKEWAGRGLSSVRIAHRLGQQRLKEGPLPVKGRSLNWHLDLDNLVDRRHLVAYVKKMRPRDLWTSPCCRTFSSIQCVNQKRYSRRGRQWRPSGEKEALARLKFCRKLHRLQQTRLKGRSHHEQSVRCQSDELSRCMSPGGGEWVYLRAACLRLTRACRLTAEGGRGRFPSVTKTPLQK